MANFCSTCGSTLNESGACSSCGISAKSVNQNGAEALVKGVTFCIPLVGLILYFVWKDTKPKASKDVCTWALIGTGVSVVFYLLLAVVGVLTNL